MKICTRCGKEKDEGEFDHCVVDGKKYLRTVCKACRYEQKCLRYASANIEKKEITRQYKQEYYKKNIKNYKEKSKKYRDNNKEKIAAKKKEWYVLNKEHVSNKCREYRSNNKEMILNMKKGWQNKKYVEDEVYRVMCVVRANIRNGLKNKGWSKQNSTHQLLDCTYEELLLHLGPKPTPDAHVDHICPCSQATTEEELLKLQHYTNLRWLPAEENLSKSDSWTPEGEVLCKQLLGRDWIHKV